MIISGKNECDTPVCHNCGIPESDISCLCPECKYKEILNDMEPVD